MSEESFRQRAYFEMRLLDGLAAPNTRFITVPHVLADFTGDLGSPLAEDTFLLNNDVIDPYAMLVPGGDDFLAQGVEYTFSFRLGLKTGEAILQAMSNTFREAITPGPPATWAVGAGVFTTASGTGANITNSAGESVPPIQASSAEHLRVHVELFYEAQLPGVSDMGFRFEECHFRVRNLNLTMVESPIRCTFRRYGRSSIVTTQSGNVDLTPTVFVSV